MNVSAIMCHRELSPYQRPHWTLVTPAYGSSSTSLHRHKFNNTMPSEEDALSRHSYYGPQSTGCDPRWHRVFHSLGVHRPLGTCVALGRTCSGSRNYPDNRGIGRITGYDFEGKQIWI